MTSRENDQFVWVPCVTEHDDDKYILQKEKTNSGYKHNKKVLHGILNLTFRVLQHTLILRSDGYKI